VSEYVKMLRMDELI